MSGEELSAPLGSLPPVKIHCAQLVEGALRNALEGEGASLPGGKEKAPTLLEQIAGTGKKMKIVLDREH